MARRTLSLAVFPATGGLQSANNPALIPNNRLSDMNNIFFGSDFTRKTRPGLVLFNTVDTEEENSQFLFDFWHYNVSSGSQSNQVVRIINGKFEADSGGDGAFVDYTGSHVISPTDVVTADAFAGLLIMAFENSPLKKYDQTTLANLGGTPRQGALYRTHAGYGWIGGIQSDPHAIDRSLAGDPQTWLGTGTETILIDDGDGDPVGVTALFPSFYGDLYVSKWRSIYVVKYSQDLALFYVQLFLRGIGCVSHNSVVAVQNDIIFCSERGVHSLVTTQKYGDVESTFLSASIQDIFKREIDFSRASQINSVYIPDFNSYVMSVPIKGSAYNRDILSYNIISQEWYRYRDINVSQVATFTDSRKKTKLLASLDNGDVIYFDEDETSDYGTDPIEVYFSTGIIYPAGAKRTVSFKSLTCIYVPQGDSEFSVSYLIDNQTLDSITFDQSGGDAVNLGPDFILGVADLGQRGTIKTETKPLSGNGRGIKLTFTRTPSGEDFDQGIEILGFVIEYIDSGDSEESTIQ